MNDAAEFFARLAPGPTMRTTLFPVRAWSMDDLSGHFTTEPGDGGLVH